MITVTEEFPATFGEYINLIEKYSDRGNRILWYRGCGDCSHVLVPSLYRHKTKNTIAELATLERQLMTRFRQRSIPFHNRSLHDDWDLLFFMQHYGVPTRLLDWTENPFFSLYFAVMNAPFEVAGGVLKFKGDAAVWILNPVEWNRYALRHQSFDEGILTPGDEELKSYKPPSPNFAKMNNHPVALYGAHNSPRIVAQRGTFLLFGQDIEPLEIAYKQATFTHPVLIKVVLKATNLPEFRRSLLHNGITESVVFPDLDGLAKEIKREFAFEV